MLELDSSVYSGSYDPRLLQFNERFRSNSFTAFRAAKPTTVSKLYMMSRPSLISSSDTIFLSTVATAGELYQLESSVDISSRENLQSSWTRRNAATAPTSINLSIFVLLGFFRCHFYLRHLHLDHYFF